MFAFKFEIHTQKCPCKQNCSTDSYFNYKIVQSAVQWHEHVPSALAATDQWPCR